MKIYLVGGAVRDQLLGLPIKERDWVVVGATPQQMIAKNYKQVGKDFPVFLHPDTHEEYALARTERKTGKGYTQFKCYAHPSVTLEDDLKRRDLTINAMAMTLDSKLIDPYAGATDLKNRILRHVSPAFAEDPVRILRVARFAAKFPDFKVHHTTNKLMKNMLDAGEVDALVAERVWQEFSRTLQEPKPQRFFEVLQQCGALQKLFPEIAAHLPYAQQALESITLLSKEGNVRFAAMLYGLDEKSVQALCQRYNIPKEYKNLALLVIKYYKGFNKALKLNAEQLLEVLESTDAFRRPERFKQFLLACTANDEKKAAYQKNKHLLNALQYAQNVEVKILLQQGFSGEKLRAALRVARIKAIADKL